MNNKNILIFALLFFALIFAACSSDDSNPSTPVAEAPASVGVYSGNNSMDTTMSVTVSNISGKAFVTSYSINFKVVSGTTSSKGSYGQTNSAGFAEVVNNVFSIAVGTEADEKFTGTINGSTMSGGFKFPANPLTPAVTGTYTITKN